jgi:2-C-methyl-D-erythritol 4-phosphate cytidylyltransferase
VVRGGDTRQDSVANALAEVPSEADLIWCIDAVRPLVTLNQIERVIAEATACDAAILGIPAMDTVKEVKRASLAGTTRALITASRFLANAWSWRRLAQVFRAALLLEALRARARTE